MRDLIAIGGVLVAVVVGASVGIVAIAFALATLIGPPSCEAETRDLHMPHRWSFWGGCQVQTASAGWVPLENVRVTVVERR